MGDLGLLIRSNGFRDNQDLLNHFLDFGRRDWNDAAQMASAYSVDGVPLTLARLMQDRDALVPVPPPIETVPVPVTTSAALDVPAGDASALIPRPQTSELVVPPEAGYPTVSDHATSSPTIEDLQQIVNAAGYAEATGEPRLATDSDSGPKTRAGLAWLAEQTGSPTADPQDPLFWQHLDTYAENITGERADAVRATVDHALDAATFPEPPTRGYPMVSARAMDNPTIAGLQEVVNAAGYAEQTGAEALVTDGDSGDLTRAGLAWLAEQTESPTSNPDDERFWQHVHRFAVRSEDAELQATIERTITTRTGGTAAADQATYTPREGNVVMAMNGIRNDPLNPTLARHLERMSEELELQLVVYSGGQPATGVRGVDRTGSTRHDNGMAADLYAVDGSGQRLSGADLAPVVQWWFDNGLGGVGFGMDHFGRDTGVHLDIHTDRDRFWRYSGTNVPRAVLNAVPSAHRHFN